MTKHQQAIQILTVAKESIAETLTDPIDQLHVLRITSELQKLIVSFSLNTGNEIAAQSTASTLGPATSSLGEPLEPGSERRTRPDQLRLSDDEKAALKAEIEKAEELLKAVDLYDDQILDTVSEKALRVLGKKYGMDVTATDPEKIDVYFVGQLRQLIQGPSKAELEANEKEAAEHAKLKADQEAADLKAKQEAEAQEKADNEAAELKVREEAEAKDNGPHRDSAFDEDLIDQSKKNAAAGNKNAKPDLSNPKGKGK